MRQTRAWTLEGFGKRKAVEVKANGECNANGNQTTEEKKHLADLKSETLTAFMVFLLSMEHLGIRLKLIE